MPSTPWLSSPATHTHRLQVGPKLEGSCVTFRSQRLKEGKIPTGLGSSGGLALGGIELNSTPHHIPAPDRKINRELMSGLAYDRNN